MTAPQERKPDKTSILRVVAVAGCVLFLAMALRMGADSLHARSAGSVMSNWKGGTMAYQDGFKLTVNLQDFLHSDSIHQFLLQVSHHQRGGVGCLLQICSGAVAAFSVLVI